MPKVHTKDGVHHTTFVFQLIPPESKSISCHQPNRPNSIAKLGTIYCRHFLDDEDPAPDDADDILRNLPANKPYKPFVHRPGLSYSSLYLESMEHLVEKGAFDLLWSLARSMESVDCVFSCLELVTGPRQLYHRMFVIEKIVPFVELMIKYMSDIPEIELRSVKKKRLEDALSNIEGLMHRVYTAKTKNQHLITLKMKVSISLLRTDQLERRIQAIKLIAEACKSAKASQENYIQSNLPVANDSEILSSLLEVPQLIKEIFGKRSHIELIRRSTEILKFILSCSKITKEDFNIIWDCCVHDEQSKVEIFKVISDSFTLLPTELLGFIVEKFLSLPRTAFKDQDVEIVCELCSGYITLSEATIRQLLRLMWRLLKGESSVSHEMTERVMSKFCDIVTTPTRTPREVMEEFFDKCYKMIETGENTMFALKILRKSMIQLPSVGIQVSRPETLFDMLTTKKVFDNFFKEFERYFEEAKRRKESLDIQRHKDEVAERKEFLLFVVRFAKYKITKKDLEILWNSMVKNSIIVEDQIAFYSFLKHLSYYKVDEYVSSIADLIDFFSQVVCAEDNDFVQLQMEGFFMIEKLLIFVNKELGNIAELETVRRRRNDNYNSYYEEQTLFCVKTLPEQIIGSTVLWKIVLEAKGEAVATRAIELISTIYTKLSKELEGSIEKISNDFVKIAMEKLLLCHQQMIKHDISRSNEIVKLLRLIEEMLDDSERKGNNGITPLGCLNKGDSFSLKIHNQVTNLMTAPTVSKKFAIMVHSKLTLWQLTIFISKKIGVSSSQLKLVMGSKEIKERDNGKSLEALGIDGTDPVKVKKREEKFVTRANLTKGKKFTEKAQKVFEEIFTQFSEDGKMSRAKCLEFTRACLADENIKVDNYQIDGIFKDYDKEEKGYLTVDNFLHFYLKSANKKEGTVWRNLTELGYGPDLNTLNSPAKVIEDNLIESSKLPRYLLANSTEYLSFLFSLVSKYLVY